jgi:hypothetical protein
MFATSKTSVAQAQDHHEDVFLPQAFVMEGSIFSLRTSLQRSHIR